MEPDGAADDSAEGSNILVNIVCPYFFPQLISSQSYHVLEGRL